MVNTLVILLDCRVIHNAVARDKTDRKLYVGGAINDCTKA